MNKLIKTPSNPLGKSGGKKGRKMGKSSRGLIKSPVRKMGRKC